MKKKTVAPNGPRPFQRIQNDSREDYVEASYFLTQKHRRPIRAIELADYMDFSKASISRALVALKGEDLVSADENRFLSLTEKGRREAERIVEKHTFFQLFLVSLGVDEETANREACQLEHVISDETFEKLRRGTAAMLAETEEGET